MGRKKSPTTKDLQAYVAYCPSCGNSLQFSRPARVPAMEAVQARCSDCGRKWSFVFDLDISGTFGVMSFQCDNEDRIMEEDWRKDIPD